MFEMYFAIRDGRGAAVMGGAARGPGAPVVSARLLTDFITKAFYSAIRWRAPAGAETEEAAVSSPTVAGNLVVGQSWLVGRRRDQAEQLDAAEQESESEEEGCGRSCQGRGERGLPGLLDVGTKEGGLGPGPLQAVGPGTGSPGPRGPGPWLGWCSTILICCIAVQLLL